MWENTYWLPKIRISETKRDCYQFLPQVVCGGLKNVKESSFEFPWNFSCDSKLILTFESAEAPFDLCVYK